jgi:DNA-binding CsgD family transcriptional regulator
MPTPLLGREAELAVLDGLLDGLETRGGSLVIRGDPGIGKSALLDELAGRARGRDMTVLTTAGVPSEMRMPFAALHRLLRRRVEAMTQLPDPQRDALAAAFGLREGTAPDIFLIALAALNLLADAAVASPHVLIVEDAHWLDAATCDVLTFVAHRLELEPILLLFAIRGGHESRLGDAGLPELELKGLDETNAGRLLDSQAPELSPVMRRRLLDAAHGNPLALVELPRATSFEGAEAVGVMAPPLVTKRLERAFAARALELPPPTQRLLLVAALDEGVGLTELLGAASILEGRPVSLADLTPAEAAGLVYPHDAGLRFRHPLVRAAIYHSVATFSRRAAHAALAEALPADPERGVWHRAASLGGADNQVAKELEEAAARALRRGAPVVAAAALKRAARVAAEPSRRGNMLLRAAEIECELGHSEVALRLLGQAKALGVAAKERPRLTFLLELSDSQTWSKGSGVKALVEAAGQLAAAGEARRATSALVAAAVRCWWGNPGQETRDLVVAAAERIAVVEDDPERLCVLAWADPVRNGAQVLDRISRMRPEGGEDPTAMQALGNAAIGVWAFDLAVGFMATAVEGFRAQGRLGLLAQALVSQTWAALHLSNETLAMSAGEEAVRFATETGQSRWAPAVTAALATLAGERGDVEQADALANEAEAALLRPGAHPHLSLVQFARGRCAVAHNRYADGFDHLKRLLDPADTSYHPFVGAWALADLVEAAVHLGRTEDARRYLAELQSLADRTSGPLLRAQLGYARPLLALPGEAEELYQSGLESDLVKWPYYRGRLLLAYGRWLRRQRRVAESRAPLRAARNIFDALAFDGLAESARQELRASGEASRRRTPDARDQLTPQEFQIAQLAAEGLSNPEIGQRLYISHRTVSSHLHRMYAKLGITSRAQLGDVLRAAQTR